MENILDDLRKTMGLDAASIGRGAIERAVRRRVAVSKSVTLWRYRQLLGESPEELRALIDSLIVPETWFFRDRGAFNAVAADAKAAPVSAQLRYLCVPCASGEEPLSLAMALMDAGIAPERFHIDAFDISERLVAHARHGVYGRNSFRGNDLAFRARYFHETGEGWAIAPAIRAQASFRQANLLDDAAFSDGQLYDAIFCRNLLIYFDPEARLKAVRKLGGSLRAGGLLCVAPAETGLLLRNGFVPSGVPQAFAFRKDEQHAAVNSHIPARHAEYRHPVPAPSLPTPRQQRQPAPVPLSSPNTQAPDPPAAALASAMRLANEGRFAEVSAICHASIAAHGASPDAYHLLALVSDASGRYEEAVAFYRKALYLDPRHQDALAHFSLLAEKLGETSTAGALRRRALHVETPAA